MPNQESIDAFLQKWKTQLRVKNAEGLVGEFLSRVKEPDFFKYITWDLSESTEGEYRNHIKSTFFISFVNVGIWRSKDDFLENIGGNIPKASWFMEPFEAAPRRRAVVEPEAWRIGQFPLPISTSNGVVF